MDSGGQHQCPPQAGDRALPNQGGLGTLLASPCIQHRAFCPTEAQEHDRGMMLHTLGPRRNVPWVDGDAAQPRQQAQR